MNTSKVIRSGLGRSGQVVRSGVFQVVRSGRGRSGQVAAGQVYFKSSGQVAGDQDRSRLVTAKCIFRSEIHNFLVLKCRKISTIIRANSFYIGKAKHDSRATRKHQR